MPETGKTVFGPEMLDEAIQDPSLDRYLDRAPGLLKFPEDYVELLTALRKKRVFNINKKEEKETT